MHFICTSILLVHDHTSYLPMSHIAVLYIHHDCIYFMLHSIYSASGKLVV